MSFNSATEILDALRELQQAADEFEIAAKSWQLSPEATERRADSLQKAFAKFAFMARTNP
jgi:hypothetical protein